MSIFINLAWGHFYSLFPIKGNKELVRQQSSKAKSGGKSETRRVESLIATPVFLK